MRNGKFLEKSCWNFDLEFRIRILTTAQKKIVFDDDEMQTDSDISKSSKKYVIK
jgi:hypothetical protein